MTNRKNALAQYAVVYAAFLETITVGGDKTIALAFAVQDMNNQTKNLDAKNAVAYILDEAEYLAGKVAA
jgi:hypothetical protein